MLIESRRGQMWRYNIVPAVRGKMTLDTAAFAAHGPTAWVASKLGADWYTAAVTAPRDGSVTSRYRYYHTM